MVSLLDDVKSRIKDLCARTGGDFLKVWNFQIKLRKNSIREATAKDLPRTQMRG